MRKWLPGALIAIAFVLSVLMLRRLPAPVTLDLGILLPFDVEGESAPRGWFAFGIPAVALVLWLSFLFATSRPGLVVLKRAFGRSFTGIQPTTDSPKKRRRNGVV